MAKPGDPIVVPGLDGWYVTTLPPEGCDPPTQMVAGPTTLDIAKKIARDMLEAGAQFDAAWAAKSSTKH